MKGQKATSKLSNAYATKAFGFTLLDIDDQDRLVKGMLSAFDVVDSDGDVIRRGAFTKSIQERGPLSESNRRIAHLRNHDWTKQIGLFLELQETDEGLVFVSKMGRSQAGEDAYRDYQDGILREHSIGFQYVKDKIRFIEDGSPEFEQFAGGYWDVTEVNLFEGSGVTFGANPMTPTLEVSKASTVEQAHKIRQERIASFEKALRNGKGSDDRLHKIEMGLKQLRAMNEEIFVSLHNSPTQPSALDTESQKKQESAGPSFLEILVSKF